MRQQSTLEDIWYRPDGLSRRRPLCWLLFSLSLPYGAAVGLRNILFDRGLLPQEKLDAKVISVGNITVGGTGKTPLVMLIAGIVRELGYRPAILSRGFGGRTSQKVHIVSDGDHLLAQAKDVGDEPFLMARTLPKVPVLIGPDRFRTGKTAIDRFGVNCLILDDAFQHRRLFRDLNIVLTDITLPFGNGHLLPAGPLREPVQALKRAHIVIRTGSRQDLLKPPLRLDSPPLRGYHRPIDLIRGDGQDRQPAQALAGTRVCAFAGLGRPDTFRKTLEALGATVAVFLTFPDHYAYKQADTEDIRRKAAQAGADLIVTTEKDAVRLEACTDFLREIFQLRIAMEIIPSRKQLETSILEGITR